MTDDIGEFGLSWGETNHAVRTAFQSSLGYFPFTRAPTTTAITSSGTLQLSETAAWVLAAAQKLESLGLLQEGWDSYRGLPLRPEAKRATVEAIQWLEKMELPVPGVVLGSAGTVTLEWRRQGKELDLDFGDGGKIAYTICDREGNVREGQTNRNEPERLPYLVHWLLNEAPITQLR